VKAAFPFDRDEIHRHPHFRPRQQHAGDSECRIGNFRRWGHQQRAGAPGLQIAREPAVPTQVLGRREFAAREEFDRELATCIERVQPHLIAVAVFMRILTAPFVMRYQVRLIEVASRCGSSPS
jgi:hypothetical protein